MSSTNWNVSLTVYSFLVKGFNMRTSNLAMLYLVICKASKIGRNCGQPYAWCLCTLQFPYIIAGLVQEWTNSVLDAQFFGLAISSAHPIRHAKKMSSQYQSARRIKTHLEKLLFAPYHLNSTYNFHFKCDSIKSFCNEAFVVWMLF